MIENSTGEVFDIDLKHPFSRTISKCRNCKTKREALFHALKLGNADTAF